MKKANIQYHFLENNLFLPILNITKAKITTLLEDILGLIFLFTFQANKYIFWLDCCMNT